MATGWYGIATNVPYGTWFHMAFVYLGPCDGVRAYHDGVLVGSQTNPSGAANSITPDYIRIGKEQEIEVFRNEILPEAWQK